jgi:hypothetical protein
LPHCHPKRSWPRVAVATRFIRRGTQGSMRSLEPGSAVGVGFRSPVSSQPQLIRCGCSPSVIQHGTISLEIKLNNMTYLSNGKIQFINGNNIHNNSVPTLQSAHFPRFHVTPSRICSRHKCNKCSSVSLLSNGYLHPLIRGAIYELWIFEQQLCGCQFLLTD